MTTCGLKESYYTLANADGKGSDCVLHRGGGGIFYLGEGELQQVILNMVLYSMWERGHVCVVVCAFLSPGQDNRIVLDETPQDIRPHRWPKIMEVQNAYSQSN